MNHMVFGLSLAAFTLFHVILSLVALLAGVFAAAELLAGRPSSRLQVLFLSTTAATSITGFIFPTKFGPAHVIGILSLVILAVGTFAFRRRATGTGWQRTYVVTAFAAFYFNAFVALIQTFQKVPFAHALAPTQKEPPFAIAQGLLLMAFVMTAVLAYRKFRTTTTQTGRILSPLSTL